jgi:formylglycine-generating enzyme required for sulfatase activity
LSRTYFIHDELGKRRASEMDLPLRIGGKRQSGIVIPDVAEDALFAHIAVSDGHAYIQPVSDDVSIFHNNEQLTTSAWLKSGDQVQIDTALLSWEVQGDKVLIDVLRQSDAHAAQPPKHPPPGLPPSGSNDMPVHADEAGHGSSKRLRRFVAVFVSVLLLAAAYLLIATPVTIKIDPEAAIVEMRGFPPPLHFWGSRLVLPGRYIVEASHPGYQALSEEVDIVMDGTTSLSYTLTELPGLLNINVNPDVAVQLYVDDIKTVLTEEGRAELDRGQHQLRIETERYLDHELQIDIQGYGNTQQLNITLQPAWAEVSISSLPAGADVQVDGESIGTTPLVTDILQGRHEIALSSDGYKTMTFMQSIEAGKDITLDTIQLLPVDGQLSVSSVPVGASVTVDGIFQGTTPISLSLVANDEHALQLSKAGYNTVEQSVSLKPDEERSVEVKLSAQYGTVFLTTRPAGAVVLIDGRKSDKNNGRLRLTARSHTLTISKPGYVTQQLKVTPQQGVSQNVDVALKTIQQQAVQKKIAATPAAITTIAGQQLQLVKPNTKLTMGASRREAGRRANESRRLVQLKRPFYFSHNEVTNGAFRKFRSSHDSGTSDSAALNGDSQPVVNVSWEDAARYANWLSKQQGLPAAYVEKSGKMTAIKPMTTGYRLPTEAEWAWVARKQGHESEQRYPWNGSYPPTGSNGNYADARIADTLADVVPGYDDGYRGTAPVASFPAWPKGYHDLGGNVAEWVHDIYAIYPGEAQRLVTDPSGPESGEHHVVRGSSWRHGNITELRLSYRDYSSKPRYDLGFRIARYAE